MGTSSKLRQFRTNPIEILIFCAVTALFVKSLYGLVYDPQTLAPITVTPVAANPLSEGRAPASTSQTFINVDLKCDKNQDQETTAAKVRLTGSLCGFNSATEPSKLLKTTITNTANKFSATVFTDTNGGKYSTDYIPLNSGKNPIRLEFSYRDKRIVTQDLTITKN
ncbi:MAG TPA: hypothetical protein VJB59_00525 [Bdellovibrionota bacterium]|nr:hypothetical protein [Bdellovibrionota bacterium]